MEQNELKMKTRGENKTWNAIIGKNGFFKNVSATQPGQQLLLDEALSVFPNIKDWVNNTSSKTYRAELKEVFKDDDILLEKILQTYFFLAGAIYHDVNAETRKAGIRRHRRINTIKNNVLPNLSFEQVWRFTEVLIDESIYFNTESKLTYKKGKFDNNIKYTSNLSEVIIEELALKAVSAFYPMPMTVPPIDWIYEDDKIRGGYETFQYEMVRATPKVEDYSVYSQSIFDAVNYIQSTPWEVNEELLKIVIADLKIPVKADFIKTEYPDKETARWDLDLDDKDLKLTRRKLILIQEARKDFIERATLYNADCNDYESAVGKFRAVKLAAQIAEKYVGKTIYFPHSYDFRGRVYPLPVGLSPQGSDAVKSLLVYKNTEELTETGIKWNWAYLASLYGDDKLPFEERIERGKQLMDHDYKEADEPYQFLSHQLELKKWLDNPDYIPNTRIHLDACNSGSQFTSAITGDKIGCIATNVIPTINEDGTQDRQDAYLLVAKKSVELASETIHKAKQEDEQELAETVEFLKGLLENDGRKICKVPVMVSNYGGTSGGRADILWNMLRELGVDRKWITKKTAYLFSKIIGDSIVGVLNGGKAFETYIHRMNNIIAKDNKPVTWTTSDGFYVVHIKNKQLRSKEVNCMLPGARKRVTISKKVYSDKVSSAKMKSAISPNYIHSLDAELLRRVAIRMKLYGISDSDWIHDSFGCHPNHVDVMLNITKEEFSHLAIRNPLRLLDEQLRLQVPDDKKSIKALAAVKVPDLKGFDTSKGDLNIVMKSNWFFS